MTVARRAPFDGRGAQGPWPLNRCGAARPLAARRLISARHHLVHLHDRFDLRVVRDVAHDLRAMLGERFLKFIDRIELEIGDGEI